MNDRTVSTLVVWVWGLWIVAIAICVGGAVVVLVQGEHIWARAVGLSLLGVEFIVVAAAALTTARLLLRRHTKRIEEAVELQGDVRKRISRLR